MLVVTRYVVPVVESDGFGRLAEAALGALTERPGCTAGWLGRAADDPTLWTLTTAWESVGAYRRALSAYEVKVHAVPLMYRAVDEATAYESVLTWTPGEGVRAHRTGRAADADTAHPGG